MTIMQKRLGALGVALIGSFVIVACVAAFTFTASTHAPIGRPSPTPTGSRSPSSTAPAAMPASSPSSPGPSPSSTAAGRNQQQVEALVPANVKKNGSVTVAVYPGSPPFDAVQGTKIVGMDVDLAGALAAVMGVKWNLVSVSANASPSAAYSLIVSQVQSGQYDVGLSDLTENKAREQQVDFVTYFMAGDEPHGIAFPKNSGMVRATQAALQLLITNGTYGKILAHWNEESGALTAAQVTINAATSS